eukprot:jgi/Ulvmu1/4578/UM002_0307.1
MNHGMLRLRSTGVMAFQGGAFGIDWAAAAAYCAWWVQSGYTLLCAMLALGWYLAGTARRLGVEHRQQQQKRRDASMGVAQDLPKLTVLIPSSGGRSRILQHWQALLGIPYPGRLEIIILVHSLTDPSFHIAQQLLTSGQGRVRVCVTGLATSCSQKIHNLCHGFKGVPQDSRYVLCLDDDAHIHSAMLQDMVHALEADPGIFLATGYPFDFPSGPRATLFAYAVLSFHFKLIIPFSAPRVSNVWGGCMLFRRADLMQGGHGLLQAWQRGGYSDDMTAAAFCAANKLRIHSPPSAVFLQCVDASTSLADCWNYIRRQMFVLDTYANSHNRVLNHLLMCVSAMDAVLTACSALVIIVRCAMAAACSLKHLASALMLRRLVVGSTAAVLECTMASFDVSAGAMLLMFGLMYMSSVRFSIIILEVVQAYAPEQLQDSQLSFPKVWTGLLVHSMLTPAAILHNLLRREITWSGIQYQIRGGRIVKVVHPNIVPGS